METVSPRIIALRSANILLFVLLGSAAALASPCGIGTVSSYLSAPPCQFGPGTFEITSFSDTFGIAADQVNVFIVNYGTASNPFYFLQVQPQSGSFGQYDGGTGTANIQVQFDFPRSPGAKYAMDFFVTTGCCDIGGDGFAGFPGGKMTESIDATTVAVIPEDPPFSEFYNAQEQVVSSFSSPWLSKSTSFDGVTSGPIAFFTFSEPTDKVPEPSLLSLSSAMFLLVLIARRRIRYGAAGGTRSDGDVYCP
jgi:hypothetical protein